MTLRDLGVEVVILPHALERYIERVRPGSDMVRARAELGRMLEVAHFALEAPDWLARSALQTAPVYATNGIDCVGPDTRSPATRSKEQRLGCRRAPC